MTPSNSVNAFKKSGIFPYNPLVISDDAIAPSTVTNDENHVNNTDRDAVPSVLQTKASNDSSVPPCEVKQKENVGGFLSKR